MATQVDIEFYSNGFKEILNSGGVQLLVQGKAEEICARANANVSDVETAGYKVTTMHATKYKDGRWLSHVQAADYAAAVAEAETKALTRAIK